jgi:hypothetical protein
MPFTKTCLQCGKTFQTNSRRAKFCSRECFHASKRIEKTCEQCGKTFVVTPSHAYQKFCSRTCREASWRGPLEKTCAWCGKTFASYAKKARFCSHKCYADSMRTQVSRKQLKHWYNELGETTDQIGERLGINGRTVRDLMEKMGIPRRDKVDAAIAYARRPFSGDKVEEAYLRGFSIGDLNVRMDLETSRTINVRSSTTRPAQVELICSLFEPYGHVHTRLGSRGETQIECHLDISFGFLLDREDRVPTWVKNRHACFWAFLAGYMDAEGYIGLARAKRGFQARVELASSDVGILRGLWRGLNARGVHCPEVHLKTRAGTISRRGYRHNYDYYRLSIFRKVSLDRLFRGIDPYLRHGDKRAEMAEAWANVRERGLA